MPRGMGLAAVSVLPTSRYAAPTARRRVNTDPQTRRMMALLRRAQPGEKRRTSPRPVGYPRARAVATSNAGTVESRMTEPSYLQRLTTRLAGGLARLSPEVRQRHASFLEASQLPDGGWADREGDADL